MLRVFDSAVANLHHHACPLTRRFEKMAFLGGRFEKHSSEPCPIAKHDRENQTGEPGAAAKIDETYCIGWNEPDQLR